MQGLMSLAWHVNISHSKLFWASLSNAFFNTYSVVLFLALAQIPNTFIQQYLLLVNNKIISNIKKGIV